MHKIEFFCIKKFHIVYKIEVFGDAKYQYLKLWMLLKIWVFNINFTKYTRFFIGNSCRIQIGSFTGWKQNPLLPNAKLNQYMYLICRNDLLFWLNLLWIYFNKKKYHFLSFSKILWSQCTHLPLICAIRLNPYVS